MKKLGLYLMALLYIAAGINHFVNPDVYLKIMPPYLPEPLLLVQISGAAEIVLGILLLVPITRQLAAWGIIALLFAVFPANIHMFQTGGEAFGVPDIFLILRLPLQGLLMYWAWIYTRGMEPAKK